MARIVIYAQNEEMASLKPLAQRLLKRGATVVFSAIKYAEMIPADQVLTLAKYLPLVEKIFAGTSTPISVIEDESTPTVPSDVKPITLAEEPTIPVLVLDLEPEVELQPVEAATVTDLVVLDDTEFEMSVGDGTELDDKPKTPRSRKAS